MNFIRTIALVLMSAVVLSGCVSFQKQAYNAAANQNIKTVAFLDTDREPEYSLAVLNHPSLSFGLIGAIAYAAEMGTKKNTLNAALKSVPYNYFKDFNDQTEKALLGAGYQVIRVPITWEARQALKNIDDIKADASLKPFLDKADAILFQQLKMPEFLANGPTADYLPSLGGPVSLIKLSDNSILYREIIVYGYANHLKALNPLVVASKPEHAFSNMDALTKNPDLTVEAVKVGVPQVIARFAEDLRRSTPNTATPAPVKP
jgi:hypothetical protein